MELLEQSEQKLEQLNSELSTTEAKVAIQTDKLVSLNESLADKQAEYKALIESKQSELADAEEKLKAVNIKAESVASTLRQLEEQAETTRKDLAIRTLALEKREEVINRKETLLSDAEDKIAKYTHRMKL